MSAKSLAKLLALNPEFKKKKKAKVGRRSQLSTVQPGRPDRVRRSLNHWILALPPPSPPPPLLSLSLSALNVPYQISAMAYGQSHQGPTGYRITRSWIEKIRGTAANWRCCSLAQTKTWISSQTLARPWSSFLPESIKKDRSSCIGTRSV